MEFAIPRTMMLTMEQAEGKDKSTSFVTTMLGDWITGFAPASRNIG
jgi:hypothetical protein